jgi:hypothetical protein
MGLVASNTVEFEVTPAGNHLARCYQVIDLGTQIADFGEGPKQLSKILIGWELSQELMEDGRPFGISKSYTLSLNDNATLRKDLESWRGRPFTDEELSGFHLHNILGKGCMLNVIHKEKNGKSRPNVSTVNVLPKGIEAPAPHNSIVSFDLDDFHQETFDRLPEWIRKTIEKSPEYQAIQAAKGGSDEPPLLTEDDIPF